MDNILEILKKVGAMLPDDHFVGTSGKHFDTYINKDALFPHTKETSEVGRMFAEKYKDENIEVVAAPAMGGIILSQWTAHHLSDLTGQEVLGVYAEKKDGELKFTRGYDKHLDGKRVLVIEDLTSTGGSLKQVVDRVKAIGGNVVAACVMVNKSPENVTTETFGVPFSSLSELKVDMYDEKECPLCQNSVPVNINIGHGKKFLDSKK
jgi:orotate phosphoribosyltransferase